MAELVPGSRRCGPDVGQPFGRLERLSCRTPHAVETAHADFARGRVVGLGSGKGSGDGMQKGQGMKPARGDARRRFPVSNSASSATPELPGMVCWPGRKRTTATQDGNHISVMA